MSESSWKGQIKKKWGPHIHCPVCGKAMPTERKFCSQPCRDNYLGQEKKKKKRGRMQFVFLIVMMAVMMIVIFILPNFG